MPHAFSNTPLPYRVGLFNELAPKEFELTRLGATLRTDLPSSANPVARFCISEFEWTPWGCLIHSVRTGETAFDHVHGMGPFDYFRKNPQASAVFNSAMTSLSARSGQIVDRYDFAGLRNVVDIGGGHGFLLATILRANPSMRGILFDLPDVVATAGQVLEKFAVQDRCECGGSFFEALPKGGDAYILRQIIHDWGDERALAILRNCRAAQTGTGKVLVIERQIVPDYRQAMRVLQVDLEMLVNVGGMERTDEQYRSLFEKADFRLQKSCLSWTLGDLVCSRVSARKLFFLRAVLMAGEFRYWHKTDLKRCPQFGRYRGESGHRTNDCRAGVEFVMSDVMAPTSTAPGGVGLAKMPLGAF